MEANHINALSTAVIAFSTILGLMAAYYYYMQSLRTKGLYIWVIEILGIALIVIFIMWAKRRIK